MVFKPGYNMSHSGRSESEQCGVQQLLEDVLQSRRVKRSTYPKGAQQPMAAPDPRCNGEEENAPIGSGVEGLCGSSRGSAYIEGRGTTQPTVAPASAADHEANALNCSEVEGLCGSNCSANNGSSVAHQLMAAPDPSANDEASVQSRSFYVGSSGSQQPTAAPDPPAVYGGPFCVECGATAQPGRYHCKGCAKRPRPSGEGNFKQGNLIIPLVMSSTGLPMMEIEEVASESPTRTPSIAGGR